MDAQWNGIAAANGGEPSGSEARRPNRDSMFLSAQLTLGSDAPREVRVRNLSERGLMAELDRAVAPGTAVTLELRGIGRITGRIAWFAEGRAGVALDQDIDPARARRRIGTRAR